MEVGQQICNGQLVVAEVDSQGNILVVAPVNKDQFGNPLTLTFQPGVSEALIESLAQAIVGQG